MHAISKLVVAFPINLRNYNIYLSIYPNQNFLLVAPNPSHRFSLGS